MKRTTAAITAVLLAGLAGNTFASGMLIPKDESLPALAIKHQRVDIRIKDGTASVSVEQVFKNSVNRDLEAVYIFPLPANAAIGEFAMYINGKRMTGELVEKDKARQIYQDIVRRMKDPGLLEHMGGNIFRISVYPVPKNGEQKIEISYSQTIEYESGLYKFVYPLKTAEQASGTLDDFTLRASVVSGVPLKNIYSPSHKTGISRKNDHEATIGFEEDKSVLDRDFVLYYGVSKKDFGINLLTHARKGQDGYFMLMVAPTVEPKDDQIVKRDVSFVFDTSGSMLGKKILQAREALKYCVNRLNKGDRFNIIRFSTDVEPMNDGFLDVNGENIEKAEKFITAMEARGGTAIDAALETALKNGSKDGRAHVIVFLTDGKPTIGETDVSSIVDNVGKTAGANSRIFVFGVGEDVNTHLLDRVSEAHGGVSEYVKPDEDIEVRVSAFADKVSLPVLGKPKLAIEKLNTRMIHPQELRDLFAGGQITIFGRYDGNGDYAVRLTGEINGKPAEFVYEGSFPKENSDNDFVPRLWAVRRVGYLLDEIRLHGEEKELKDEVVALGKEYGIMTPYTSYLVLEDDNAYAQHNIPRADARITGGAAMEGRGEVSPAADGWAAGAPKEKESGGKLGVGAPAAVPMFGDESAMSRTLARRRVDEPAPAVLKSQRAQSALREESGRDAISVSEAIFRYKKADLADDNIAAAVKRAGDKLFYLVNGVWTDRDYKEGMTVTRVKYASEEYFKLLSDKPELKKYLALGEKVIVCMDDKTALVVE